MHMAITDTFVDEWIVANTTLCLRFQTRLTEEACRKMRQRHGRFGDLLCAGCEGLNNQPEPLTVRVAVSPVSNEPEIDISEKANEQVSAEEAYELEGMEDAWIEMDADSREALLKLYPGLKEELASILDDDDIEQEPQLSHRTPSQIKKKVAVYMGRCARCGGYMVNALERHDGIKDNEVYRCFTCGWRTSPAYESNRNNQQGAM